MTRVGIWLTAQRPEGAYTVAADLSRLPGVHVVARPEDALPTGTRRVSVYRFPRTMTVIIGLKAVASAVLHAVSAVETRLTTWPTHLGEWAWSVTRSLIASRQRVLLAFLLAALPVGLLAVWLLVALSHLVMAMSRGLLAPLLGFVKIANHLSRHHSMRAAPEDVVRRTGCDVWLVPSLECDFPYPLGVPVVVVMHGNGPPDVLALRREQARLWAARQVEHLPTLDELRDLVTDLPLNRGVDMLCSLGAGERDSLPCVLLFLPRAYQGGVWEAARTLVNALHAVNQRRRNIRLTLAVPVEQVATGLASGVEVERLTMRVLTHEGRTVCVPLSPTSLRAAAWFALVDRFPAVVWPARPLGLIVHDVIQLYVPESFPVGFHTHDWPIIRQTIAAADRVITTSHVTRRDVINVYGLDETRTTLVPVACEPSCRFGSLTPRRVDVPDGCILNPTNAAPHKGAEVLLRGYALARRNAATVPPMVLCGAETDRFGPDYHGTLTPYWRRVRRLVAHLGLRPGRDVYFLGYVDDAQLLDLFTRCRVVVNAARYDNGTYSLIEATYFGKPTVCSDYPAARELYGRYGVEPLYFPVEDAVALAEAVRRALQQSPPDVEFARRRLSDPRHSYESYAEAIYEQLWALTQGR